MPKNGKYLNARKRVHKSTYCAYALRVKDKTLDDKLKFIEHYKMYIQCESNNLIQYN